MKESNVALIIIFNHRYDKNLPILEELYKDRFTHRYYLVPFYDGNQENVIPVYGRSIFFESYIAQAAKHYIKENFKHYLFIADDMIIHPQINEYNYQDFFEVNDEESFIPQLTPIQDMKKYWIGTMSAFFYRKKQKYIEAAQELPDEEEALNKMRMQNIEIRPLNRQELFGDFTLRIDSLANKTRLLVRTGTFLKNPFKRTYKLPYPCIGSYSDIVVVSSNTIQSFTHYCGVFGATCLFAEVAIPTALVLASNHPIKTERETTRKGRSYWVSEEAVFWDSEESNVKLLDERYKDLNDLFIHFPDNFLYIHPIKLSKWIKK